MKETPLRAIEILHAQAGPAASRADGSLRLSFITPELLSSQAGACIQLHGKNVRLTIIPEDVDEAELIKVETGREIKSPSQRLRSILFLCWKQAGEPGDFNSYYSGRIDKLCEHLRRIELQ